MPDEWGNWTDCTYLFSAHNTDAELSDWKAVLRRRDVTLEVWGKTLFRTGCDKNECGPLIKSLAYSFLVSNDHLLVSGQVKVRCVPLAAPSRISIKEKFVRSVDTWYWDQVWLLPSVVKFFFSSFFVSTFSRNPELLFGSPCKCQIATPGLTENRSGGLSRFSHHRWEK